MLKADNDNLREELKKARSNLCALEAGQAWRRVAP
jgi:hypothetical protein